MSAKVPTLYEWAGGIDALNRLTSVFYDTVLKDPLLEPVPPDDPLWGGVVGMIPPPQPTRKRPATTTTPILSMKFPFDHGDRD